ncbi:ribokinase [Ruminococcus sp. OA3]|uniref:ribokinase n=1 Tax=Ruminococcus sp. OA3 TaxID=2914164 RepID=UPI001F05C430|nr:ribokinase [Ruminococcus sp. OA3]MCH1982228.1 ribokinase [Ruminococcus sp. OA3]
MNCDVLAMGPLSLDVEELRHRGVKREYIGGALPFAVHAVHSAGREVCGLVKCAPEDFHILRNLPAKQMFFSVSKETTKAEAIYYTESQERRDIFINAQIDPIGIADIPDVAAKIYHMAGIYYGDYDEALFTYLSGKGSLACDIQCYVRYEENREIVYRDWAEKRRYIPYITYLKADAREAQILTGCEDREEAARIIVSWGAREVMITHHTEVIVYDGVKMYRCPLRPRAIDGRAGRGDTTFGSYLAMRLEQDIPSSLLYAAAAVSLKLETTGPLKASRSEVVAYMKERYAEFL